MQATALASAPANRAGSVTRHRDFRLASPHGEQYTNSSAHCGRLTNALLLHLTCRSCRRDLSIRPADVQTRADPPSREETMKTLLMTAAMVVGIVINLANAAPLPEARPDDVGFSQQGLTRLDEFFAR